MRIGGVQVSDYSVCMSRRWRGGGTALCAAEGWVGGCQLLTELIILDVKVLGTYFDFINSTKTRSFQTYDKKVTC